MIGRIIHLDGHPFTVIGVQPPDFPVLQAGTDAEITIPLHADAMLQNWKMLEQNNVWWMSVFGRLRPGAQLSQANAEVSGATGSVFRQLGMNSEENAHPSFGVIPGSHGNRDFVSRYDKPLYVLMSIAFAVLCIGSLNIANLLLARSVARERELGVRVALGAGRFRLLRQLITESFIVAVLGGALGLAGALWVTRSASRLIDLGEISIDWRVFAFAAVISLLVTLLCGLMPAIRGVALGTDALKAGRAGQMFRSAQLSRLVVCTQVALSLALISSAFLFAKSFHALITQDPGFAHDNLVFCHVDTQRAGLNSTQAAAFFGQALERLRATPASLPQR